MADESRNIKVLNSLKATWTGVKLRAGAAGDTEQGQVAWIDEDSGEIRDLAVVEANSDLKAGLALSLWQAMESPLNGAAGVPRKLVVEDGDTAAYIRERLNADHLDIPIEVAENTLAAQALATSTNRVAHSVGYTSRDDCDVDTIRHFFAAARDWAQLEPWMAVNEGEMLKVDGLCGQSFVIVVLGAGAVEQGLALFRSLEDVAVFAENPYRVRLFFQYTDEYVAGPGVLAEIEQYGLPVASKELIPVASCPVDGNAFASSQDLQLLIRAMQVVEAYVESDLPSRRAIRDVALSIPAKSGDAGLHLAVDAEASEEVRLTLCRLDEPQGSGEPRRKLGRNDPCWCGSGKKYKKCCLKADEITLAGRASEPLGDGR